MEEEEETENKQGDEQISNVISSIHTQDDFLVLENGYAIYWNVEA